MTPHNMALNLAPFGRWTLRDKAAQRRLALRWASIAIRMKKDVLTWLATRRAAGAFQHHREARHCHWRVCGYPNMGTFAATHIERLALTPWLIANQGFNLTHIFLSNTPNKSFQRDALRAPLNSNVGPNNAPSE